jgi:hypothetical protein
MRVTCDLDLGRGQGQGQAAARRRIELRGAALTDLGQEQEQAAARPSNRALGRRTAYFSDGSIRQVGNPRILFLF